MADSETPAGTIRQAAVLVGGLGTRLGDLAAGAPKPLLDVGGRPFLAWVLRELCRYGVEQVLLLAGHAAERVRDRLPEITATLPRPLDLQVLDEPGQAGTGGALFHARARLAERFLLLNGDSLFDANWAGLLADAVHDDAAICARLLLRRTADTGRYGCVVAEDGVVTRFSERPDAHAPASGLVNAGVYVVSRGLLDHLSPVCGLERDILPALAAQGALRSTERTGWFVDIGTADSLARARGDVPVRFGRRPALILDRDGVLNRDHGYVGHRERFEWTETAREAVRTACERGWHVFVATNQSGVARGYYDEAAVLALYDWMRGTLHAFGATLDDWRYCPTHPEGSVAAYARESDWRKPGPGMLRDLLRAWRLDPGRCVMVGDQVSDVQAAEAAGVAGHLFTGGDLCRSVMCVLDNFSRAGADEAASA